MGQGAKRQVEVSVQEITSVRLGSRIVLESKFQYVRLWRLGAHQYLLFHANISSTGVDKKRRTPEIVYKEYRMDHLKMGKKKSKEIELEADISDLLRQSGSQAQASTKSSTLRTEGLQGRLTSRSSDSWIVSSSNSKRPKTRTNSSRKPSSTCLLMIWVHRGFAFETQPSPR